MKNSLKHPLVELEHVYARYDSEIVLQDITTAIYPFDCISIIGPNGSGKTTLLKIILGLMKPSSGTIRLFSHYNDLSPDRIGYVPQHLLYDPSFPITALEVALLGRIKPGFYKPGQADKAAAMHALHQLGLTDLAQKRFQELSGGQRQRVLIARALAGEPALLLLDEPTANIDRDAEKDMYTLIRKLSEVMAVVLVSHDLGVVPKISTRVFCLNRSLKFHETTELTGADISAMYKEPMDLVKHHAHDLSQDSGKKD